MDMKLIVVFLAVGVTVAIGQTTPEPVPIVMDTEDEIMPNNACNCPMDDTSVCGADGKTYANMCMMMCSKMRMLHMGECEEDLCICTFDVRPVCGKDGVTYTNDCSRMCRKVDFDHDGQCEDK